MKLQSILPIVAYADTNCDAVAANAVTVAAHLGADLYAVVLQPHIPQVSKGFSGAPLIPPDLSLANLLKDVEALSQTRGEELLAKVSAEAALQSVDLTTGVLSNAFSLLGEAAATEARYFDVALIGWAAGNSTSKAIAEAILFGSGKPVVLLPELRMLRQIDHIAVAWDGSRVAARAVADAAFFFERASRISVVTVVDEKPLAKEDDANA